MMPIKIDRGGVDGLYLTFGKFYFDTFHELFEFISEVDDVYYKRNVGRKLDEFKGHVNGLSIAKCPCASCKTKKKELK